MTVIDAVPVVTIDRPHPADQVDRITAQARQWPAGRTLLTLLAALLVGIGRLAYGVCAAVWLVLTWCTAAVVVGWSDARETRQQRTAEALRRAGDDIDA